MIRLAAILACLSGAAWGQECNPRPQVSVGLQFKYGEQQQFALTAGRQLLEIWMNVDSQTWTIIRVDASGCAVLVASGSGVVVNVLQAPGRGG